VEIRRVENVGELPAVSAITPLSPEQRAEQQLLVRAVESVNDAKLFGQSNELTFTFDRHTKRPVMRIVNKETQEVVRQLPPEYVLRLAEELD